MGLFMTFIWFNCFTWQAAMVKLADHFHESQVQYFTVFLLIAFAALCFAPLHCFYLKGRIQLARSLGNILISPFGKVRFRHFFLADVITSMTGPLQHLFFISCYYKEKHFIDDQSVKLSAECPTANTLFWIMAFLPYWFRFAQCLRKYYDSRQTLNLWNAGKYSTGLITPGVLFFMEKKSDPGLQFDVDWLFWLYLSCKTVQTTYCFIWDVYIDWGLFRHNAKGSENRFLRPKINYSPGFYYYAIVSDFVLRYIYILFLFNLGDPKSNFNNF